MSPPNPAARYRSEQQDLRQPLVVDPGLAEASERVGICMEDAMVLQGQLPGAEVPPDVRVGNAARGHDEQAESENGHEHAASL